MAGRILSVLIAIVCLTACAGQGGNASEEPPVHRPLRIEARKHGGEYRLFLNDEPEPSTTDQILDVLESYAEIEDEAAGLPGRDKYIGVARNPLFFRAPHDAPWKLFAHVMEMAVEWKYTSIAVQLEQRAGGIATCQFGLPMDESLSYARDGGLDLLVNVEDNRISYDARVCKYDTDMPFKRSGSVDYVPLQVGEHAMAWDTVPESVAPRVAKRLHEMFEGKMEGVNDMGILFHGDLNWGETFIAICAAHELEKLLGRESDGYFNVGFRDLESRPIDTAENDE